MLSRDRIQLPLAGPAGAPGNLGAGRGSGFTATIHVRNQFGVGYVGVEATLTSTLGPLAATRDLRIRFTPIDRQLPAEAAVAIDLPLTFEQGQSSVTVARAFPKWTTGNSYRVEITEDGAAIDNYSTEIGNPFPGYMYQSPGLAMPSELLTNFLLVDTEPDVLPESALFPFQQTQEPNAIQSRSLDDLPADWRLINDLDCVVIEYRRLIPDSSAVGSPNAAAVEQARAGIRDWLLMGGTLVVLNAPAAAELAEGINVSLVQSKNDEAGLTYLVSAATSTSTEMLRYFRERMLTMKQSLDPASSSGGLGTNGQIFDSGGPQGAMVGGSIVNGASLSGMVGLGGMAGLTAEQLSESEKWLDDYEAMTQRSKQTWRGSYQLQAGYGRVIGLTGSQFDQMNSFSILNRWIGLQRSPILERGVDPMLGDFRSRRWLIPGVAQPPVYTFIGILTLFVLLVGPVAYRWTSRGHRSHLMFLIAPVLALVTTAAMFAYSIVADGFGTSVRVRQLTWIDGASGDAVERTRSTLFAGISPRSGLKFPAGAELMIYPDGGRRAWEELNSGLNEVRARMVVRDNEQELDSSFLPSRTQSQFVTHNIRRGVGALSLGTLQPFDSGEAAVNVETVSITSSLPFEIRDLVVCSPDGRYWTTPRIGAGETTTASWIKKSQEASKQIGELYIRHRLIGAVSQSSGVQRQTVRDLMLYLNRENNVGGTVMTDGIMERWLNDQLFLKGDLPPGMFIGISDPSDDSVAVPSAEQTASVRYVMGTLQ